MFISEHVGKADEEKLLAMKSLLLKQLEYDSNMEKGFFFSPTDPSSALFGYVVFLWSLHVGIGGEVRERAAEQCWLVFANDNEQVFMKLLEPLTKGTQ